MTDKILVIEHGEIIESGTHQSLMELGKTYYTMYQNQLLEMDKQKVD